jgi:hypothetical protein
MYVRGPLRKPLTMQLDPTEGYVPMREFGVSRPNETFRPAESDSSMPSPEGGLSAKDEIVLRLSSLQPETEAQKELRGILLGELSVVLEKIKTLETEVHDQRFARLTAEHKKIRIEGRKAEKELQAASEAFQTADLFAQNMMSMQESQQIVLEHLREDEKRGVHLKRFHTDKELEDWNERVEEAKGLWRAAAELATDAVNDRKQRQEDLTEAKEKVARLAGIESAIRAELKGLPIWDSETGLGRPGQGRMTTEILDMMRARDE